MFLKWRVKNLSSKEGKVRDQVLRFAVVILLTGRAHNAVHLLVIFAAKVKLPKKVTSGAVGSVEIVSRIWRRIPNSKIIINKTKMNEPL